MAKVRLDVLLTDKGFFESREALCALGGGVTKFFPEMDAREREASLDGWHRAVRACRSFTGGN